MLHPIFGSDFVYERNELDDYLFSKFLPVMVEVPEGTVLHNRFCVGRNIGICEDTGGLISHIVKDTIIQNCLPVEVLEEVVRYCPFFTP